MRKNKLLLLLLISSGVFYGQVGINTNTPRGVFYVGANKSSDDIIVTANGDVGVGVSNPQAKLDINGKIKITDGTQKEGYVMTADEAGKGTWQYLSSTLRPNIDNISKEGVDIHLIQANNSNNGSVKWFYCNSFFDVDTGQQLIGASLYSSFNTSDLNLIPRTGYYKVSYRLSVSDTKMIEPTYVTTQGGKQISTISNIPNYSACNSGYWIVDNTTQAAIKLYLWVSVYYPLDWNYPSIYFSKLGSSAWVENIVISSPINTIF